MAEQAALDLVEISPNAEPPVCRIMNYGKFLYEKSKTAKEQKKKQKTKKYDEVDMAQMSLFDTVKDDDVLEELKSIDVGNLTPVDALNTIYRLQNKLKNRW